MCDIYSGDLNFVFGLGSLSGRTGVYSFCRQDDAFYREGGLSKPEDEGKMIHRASHTVVHELGHMCGMGHCTFYRCTMQGSNGLEESEAHPLHLCPVCLLKLKYCLQINLHSRYEGLKAVCEARPDTIFGEETSWWSARLGYLNDKTSPSPSVGSTSVSATMPKKVTRKKSNGSASLKVISANGKTMKVNVMKVKTATGHRVKTTASS